MANDIRGVIHASAKAAATNHESARVNFQNKKNSEKESITQRSPSRKEDKESVKIAKDKKARKKDHHKYFERNVKLSQGSQAIFCVSKRFYF